MTSTHMTPPMTSKAVVFFVGIAISVSVLANDLVQIPTRKESSMGQFILTPHLDVAAVDVSAGKWTRRRIALRRDGKPIWIGPLTNVPIRAAPIEKMDDFDFKLLSLDVDGNGKQDWLYLRVVQRWGAYSDPTDFETFWEKESGQKQLLQQWSSSFCSSLGGLIVLDDEKTAYVFSYASEYDPFQSGNLAVQGRARVLSIINGWRPGDRLRVSSPIPAKIWDSIYQLVESHACNTPDWMDKKPLPEKFRIKWDTPQEPFGLDWKPYLEDGLAMYRRAQVVYEARKKSMPREEWMTQDGGLSVFRFDAFFKTFPHDEIDPENKSPEYTAMLNDYAFYLMAPRNAEEAQGYYERREPLLENEAVLAMLAQVIRRDPKRAVAYLNLGDALWKNGQDADAAGYYRRYMELLRAGNPKASIPARVFQRAVTGR